MERWETIPAGDCLGWITGLLEKGTTVEPRFTDTRLILTPRYRLAYSRSHELVTDFSRLLEKPNSKKIVEF